MTSYKKGEKGGGKGVLPLCWLAGGVSLERGPPCCAERGGGCAAGADEEEGTEQRV